MTSRIGSGSTPLARTTGPATAEPLDARTTGTTTAPTRSPGWTAGNGSNRRTTTGSAPKLDSASATAGVTPSPLRAASPTDALKAIRSGDVDITIPVKAGELLPGKLTAKENTVVRMTLKVKDGNIDFAKSKVTMDPPLTGPLGVTIENVSMRSDGRAEVELRYLPNLVIGNAAPAKLSDFIDKLNTAESLPVKVLGITVASLPTGNHAGAASSSTASAPSDGTSAAPAPSAAPAAASPDDVSRLMSRIDLAAAKVSVKNVSFQGGAVPLGQSGHLQLGSDTTLTMEGSLTDLSLHGRANIQELSLDAGGTSIRGGRGSADLDLKWSSDAAFKGQVQAKVSNLNLQADYAVSRRENGDYLELAKGKIENGSISITQPMGPSGAVGKPAAELHLGRFEGTVNGGQITVADGDGTATIKLGKTTVKGTVDVTPEKVLVSGDVDLKADVTGFDTSTEKTRLSFSEMALSGRGHAVFDSTKGLEVDGAVQLKTQLERGGLGSRHPGENGGELTRGRMDLAATHFSMGPGLPFDLKGKADVDLGFKDIHAGDKGISMAGSAGRVTGKADVRISDDGLALSNGALKLSASVEDGRMSLGDSVGLKFKAGTRIDSALHAAVFGGNGVSLDLAHTRVSAALSQGTVTLPNGKKVEFKDGTQLDFTLDRLVLPEQGVPEASGTMELKANLSAKQIDVDSLRNLPGVSIQSVEGVEQTFKLKVGRFDIARSGAFDVSDMSFGLEANVRHIGGVIR